MLGKFAAAVLMPLLSAALVGGLLKATHHDKIPPLALPVAAQARPDSGRSPSAVPPGPCLGAIPRPFTGIAVQHQPAVELAKYGETFPAAPLHIVEFYNAFGSPFVHSEASQAVEAGMIPFIQLNPRRFSEQQIANGVWDRRIKAYAKAVKAFGCTVILSFGHEMNGWWYPWGREPAPNPSTSPAAFKAAWIHIHDIFAAQGVTNVIWSWDPSHQHGEVGLGKIGTPASEWYPGDKYVDWIGIDGYVGAGQNFRGVFGYQLRVIRRLTSKPIYLAETGVGDGPHERRQVANLFAGVRQWHLIGLIWFDLNRKNSWSLEGKPAKDAAFRRGIARFP